MSIICVSNSGSDSTGAAGATTAIAQLTPFLTLSAAIAAVTANNDSVLLNCGDEFHGDIAVPAYSGLTLGSYGSGALPLIWGKYGFKLNCRTLDEYKEYGAAKNTDTGINLNGRFINSTTSWTLTQTGGTLVRVTDHPAGSGETYALKGTRTGTGTFRAAQTVNLAADQLYELRIKVYTEVDGVLKFSSWHSTDGLQDTPTGDVYATWVGLADYIPDMQVNASSGAWVTKTIKIRAPAALKNTELRFDFGSGSTNAGVVYLTDVHVRPLMTNVSGNIWSMGWNVTSSATQMAFNNNVPMRKFNSKLTETTVANPTVCRTRQKHGFAATNTFTVVISEVSGVGYTPTINGTFTATAIDAYTFSVPVNCTTAGDLSSSVIYSQNVNSTLQYSILSTGIASNAASIMYFYATSDPMAAGESNIIKGVSASGAEQLDIGGALRTGFTVDAVQFETFTGINGCYVDATAVTFKNSTIYACIGGVYCDMQAGGGFSSINNVWLGSNDYFLRVSTNAVVRGNTFTNVVNSYDNEGGAVWWYGVTGVTCEDNVFSGSDSYAIAPYGAVGAVNAVVMQNTVIQRNRMSDCVVGIWEQSASNSSTGNVVKFNLISAGRGALNSFISGSATILPAGSSTGFICYRDGNNTVYRNNLVDGCSYGVCLAINPNAYAFTDNIFTNIATCYQRFSSSNSTSLSIIWTNNMYKADGAAMFQGWNGTAFATMAYTAWEALSGVTEYGVADPGIDASFVVASTSPTRNVGTANTDNRDVYGNYNVGNSDHIGAIYYIPVASSFVDNWA